MKLSKILSALMVTLMVICVSTSVFATTGLLNFDDIDDNKVMNTEAANQLGKIGGSVIALITNIGMILAVAVIALLGVKYMMGSSEEKAEYKKSMIPYLVGAVLVFGASAIAKFVSNFGAGITG